MRHIICLSVLFVIGLIQAQNTLTPKDMIELNRVNGSHVDLFGNIYYSVKKVDLASNSSKNSFYMLDRRSGKREGMQTLPSVSKELSPDGKYKIIIEDVKIWDVFGSDYYPGMEKSKVQI